MNHRHPSNSNNNDTANGVIRVINQKKSKSKFAEIIYIGILLRSTRSDFKVQDWPAELNKHEPITDNFKKFTISKADWFLNGKIFVVPTHTFGITKIEIFLHEHAIIGTGFDVEVFQRVDTKKMTFNNSKEIALSLGGTISMTVNWQLIKLEAIPLIRFKPPDHIEVNDSNHYSKKQRNQ